MPHEGHRRKVMVNLALCAWHVLALVVDPAAVPPAIVHASRSAYGHLASTRAAALSIPASALLADETATAAAVFPSEGTAAVLPSEGRPPKRQRAPAPEVSRLAETIRQARANTAATIEQNNQALERSFKETSATLEQSKLGLERSLKETVETVPAIYKKLQEDVAPAIERSLKQDVVPAVDRTVKAATPVMAKAAVEMSDVIVRTVKEATPIVGQSIAELADKAQPVLASAAQSAATATQLAAKQAIDPVLAQASVALNDKIMSTRTVLASRYEALDPEQRRLLEAGGRTMSEVLSSAAPLVDEGVRQASPHVTKAIKATTRMGAQFARVELVKKVDEIDTYLMREDPAYVPPPGGTLFARLPGGGGSGLGSGGRSSGRDSVVSAVVSEVSEVGGGAAAAVEVTKSAAEVVSSVMATTAATEVAAAPAPPPAPTVMEVEAQAVESSDETATSTTMASSDETATSTTMASSDETATPTTMASSDETATPTTMATATVEAASKTMASTGETAASNGQISKAEVAEEATPSVPKAAPMPSAGMVRFIQTFTPIQAASASDEAAIGGAAGRDQSAAAAADEEEGSYDDADYDYDE